MTMLTYNGHMNDASNYEPVVTADVPKEEPIAPIIRLTTEISYSAIITLDRILQFVAGIEPEQETLANPDEAVNLRSAINLQRYYAEKIDRRVKMLCDQLGV